jgi:hypothetical protein
MIVSKQVIAGAKKDFWSSFTIPLSGYPVACKIANINLFGELFTEKTVLVFGTYDLVFCFRKGSGPDGPAYDTEVVTRTFSESINFIGSGISGTLSGTVEVQANFSRPLRIYTRPGKLTNLTIGEFIKSIVSRKVCVEVQVESEIASETMLVKESVQESAPPAQPEPPALSEKKAGGKDHVEREDSRAGGQEGKSPDTGKETPPEEKAGKKESQMLDPEKFADLVEKILRQREEKKSGLRAVAKYRPEKADPRADGVFPAGAPLSQPAFDNIDLGKIPSRPGLCMSFLQNAPPPKPPGTGG